MAAPVLISYSWDDAELAERLERLLRLRGVPVWRDRSGLSFGSSQENEILRVIAHEAAGAVLLLSPSAVSGGVGFIPEVELPAIHARDSRDPAFFFGALFLGLTPSEAQLAVHRRTGISIGASWGVPLADPTDEALERAANAILRAYLKTLPDGAIALRVDSRDAIALDAEEALHLALAPPLAHDMATVDPAEWATGVLPGLEALRAGLTARGLHEVTISGRPHLSLALALGHALRAPGPWQLRLAGAEGTIWSAAPSSAAVCDGWRIDLHPGVLTSGPKDLVVTIGATTDITRAVGAHRAGLDAARATISVVPGAGPGRSSVDSTQANDLAAAVAARIREAHARFRTEETHLYLACPWPLATLLGHHLASSGPVRSFEADAGRSSYLPACLLI